MESSVENTRWFLLSVDQSGRFVDQSLLKELLDGLNERLHVGQLVDLLAELATVGETVGVPAGELPQLVQRVALGLTVGDQAEVVEDEIAPVAQWNQQCYSQDSMDSWSRRGQPLHRRSRSGPSFAARRRPFARRRCR